MGLTGPAQRGNRMRLLVIDGQGGGVGKSLIAAVKRLAPEQAVIAAGTNAQATAAMLRAGADLGATGEISPSMALACKMPVTPAITSAWRHW